MAVFISKPSEEKESKRSISLQAMFVRIPQSVNCYFSEKEQQSLFTFFKNKYPTQHDELMRQSISEETIQ